MVTRCRKLSARPLDESRWRDAKWLIIAPHADDEIIGCGALIAQTAAAGNLAGIAFLTDGSGSHPMDGICSGRKLAAVRRGEARNAVRLITSDMPRFIFLDWPDAKPYARDSVEFVKTARSIAAFCNSKRVNAIAVTARNEPHCDHVAAHQIAVAAKGLSVGPIDVLEYLVWSALPPASVSVTRTRPMSVAVRNRALRQHRSQMTPLFGAGFNLPDQMRRMPASDLLFYDRHR